MTGSCYHGNMNIMIDTPYIKRRRSYTEYLYNPGYGDSKLCKCGHDYFRHFDTYEDMAAVGCKYCGSDCAKFRPAKLECK